MEIESPVKKKKKRNQAIARPSECIIHTLAGEDDKNLSAFTHQSWQVRDFCL